MSEQTTNQQPVDMELLEKIYAQFQAYAAKMNRVLQPRPQHNLRGQKKLDAFKEYLRGLSKDSGRFGCDPEEHCSDGSCPPCPDWNRRRLEAYLQKLQQRLAGI
jgi:hypothetical protein